MNGVELKKFLEEKYLLYNQPSFIESDPVSIPHLFTRKEDIEISSFFTATIAWGQRTTIINNANRLMLMMDKDPYNFILNFTERDSKLFEKFVHRTFNGVDCVFFLKSLKNIYTNHGGLEKSFSGSDVKDRIRNFRNLFLSTKHPTRSLKHISNPAQNSASKRLNMFLRWMVRKDDCGVDFGIWKQISSKDLICPLDIHSRRVARKLGLLKRKQNDWQAAEELTAKLRLFDPNDPVKYDFALFGLGVFENF